MSCSVPVRPTRDRLPPWFSVTCFPQSLWLRSRHESLALLPSSPTWASVPCSSSARHSALTSGSWCTSVSPVATTHCLSDCYCSDRRMASASADAESPRIGDWSTSAGDSLCATGARYSWGGRSPRWPRGTGWSRACACGGWSGGALVGGGWGFGLERRSDDGSAVASDRSGAAWGGCCLSCRSTLSLFRARLI